MAVGNHTLPTDLLQTCEEGLFWCISNWANVVTSSTFWMFMLLAFCVALFMATGRFGSRRAFGFASVVGLLGAVWLAVLRLMTWDVASVFVLVGMIGLVVMIITEK